MTRRFTPGALAARVPIVAGWLLSVGGCLVGAAPLRAYYAGGAWPAPLVVTAVLGGLLGCLVLWRRAGVVAVAVAGAVLSAPVLAAVLRPGETRQALTGTLTDPGAVAGLLAGVAGDVVRGWSRMLSVGVPTAPTPPLLAAPVAVLWVAAITAAVLALRTRSVLAPLAPSAVVFVLAVMVLGRGAGTRYGETAAYLGVALLLAYLRAQTRTGPVRGPGGLRQLAAGGSAVGLASVLLAGAVAIPAAAASGIGDGRQRFDPRDLVQIPADVLTVRSPMLGLKAQLADGSESELFRVSPAPGSPVPGLVRVAVLDTFDGVTWQADDTFSRPPAQLPAVDTITGAGRVDLTISVGRLRGPFLPVAGQLVSLDADEVVVSPSAATVIAPDGVSSGRSYRIRADLPATTSGLDQAQPDGSGGAARDLILPPGMPPALAQLGAKVMGGAADPAYVRLKRLEAYLRAMPYGLSAAPGESYAVLSRLMATDAAGAAAVAAVAALDGATTSGKAGPGAGQGAGTTAGGGTKGSGAKGSGAKGSGAQAGGGAKTTGGTTTGGGAKPTGTIQLGSSTLCRIGGAGGLPSGLAGGPSFAEQRASAFAVLARSAHLPARVVVGYRIDPERASGGGYQVLAADAHAWPEVHLTGFGWVPFEPTDSTRTRCSTVATDDPSSAQGTSGQREGDDQALMVPLLPRPPEPGTSVTAGARWRRAAMLAATATVGLVLVVPLVKLGRRIRRRYAGSTARRVVGAWAECRDRLVEAGVAPRRSRTPGELAAEVGDRVGEVAATALGALAALVDRALYAPVSPLPADAAAAWRHERAARRALRRLGARRGVGWARFFDPRPLLGGARR